MELCFAYYFVAKYEYFKNKGINGSTLYSRSKEFKNFAEQFKKRENRTDLLTHKFFNISSDSLTGPLL